MSDGVERWGRRAMIVLAVPLVMLAVAAWAVLVRFGEAAALSVDDVRYELRGSWRDARDAWREA